MKQTEEIRMHILLLIAISFYGSFAASGTNDHSPYEAKIADLTIKQTRINEKVMDQRVKTQEINSRIADQNTEIQRQNVRIAEQNTEIQQQNNRIMVVDSILQNRINEQNIEIQKQNLKLEQSKNCHRNRDCDDGCDSRIKQHSLDVQQLQNSDSNLNQSIAHVKEELHNVINGKDFVFYQFKTIQYTVIIIIY